MLLSPRWRCRFRLYFEGEDTPIYDSDPQAAPDKPGILIIEGLVKVAEHLQKVVEQFHQEYYPKCELREWTSDILKHRLKSLRPTISRKSGFAVWRVPFTVTSGEQYQDFIARVDVQRVHHLTEINTAA
jgi:hypothetical protein